MKSKKEFECHFCKTIKRCGTEDKHPKDFQDLQSDKKVKTTKIGLNENKVKTMSKQKIMTNLAALAHLARSKISALMKWFD